MSPVITLNRPLIPLILAVTAFTVLKLANLAPKLSDEGFYFYTANLLAQGQLPYQDFFFQHLPGQLLLLAGIIKVFGYNLYLLKTIPILASIGTAILLYFLSLKSPTSLIAPILFLFSLTVLATTDHSTGVHEAVFLLTLMWFLLHKQKFFWAGIILFLGLTYRIYILPAALGLVFYYFLTNPQPRLRLALRLLISGLIPFVLLNLALWQAYDEKFLTPVWRYHFLKSEGIDKGKIITFFLTNEWVLLGLAVVGLMLLIAQKSKFQMTNPKTNSNDKNPDSRFIIYTSLFGLLAQAIFLIVFADIYYFYLVTLIPFLAVLAAYSIRSLMSLTSPILVSPKSLILLLASFAAINLYNYQTNHAPVSVVTNLDRIKGDVKGLTRENQTIWGSFLVTPLVALESDRKITENQVDTNAKRHLAGFLSTDEATRLATESSLFIQTATLDTSGRILSLEPDYVIQHVIQDSCALFRIYPIPKDYEKNAILLWHCQ